MLFMNMNCLWVTLPKSAVILDGKPVLLVIKLCFNRQNAFMVYPRLLLRKILFILLFNVYVVKSIVGDMLVFNIDIICLHLLF